MSVSALYDNLLKYFVEFLGTLFFLYVILASNGNPVFVGGALAIVVAVFSGISGGHFNPAVTIMMAFYKKSQMDWGNVIPYIVAQIAGGLAAIQLYTLQQNVAKNIK
jgi:glycerol uptake facilitator-like aquaporin